MPEYFFDLPADDQRALLEVGSRALGMQPFILEKDVWLCWALSCLFGISDKPDIAFKGGTSLSKVYKTIDRFSEDVDITIDYRSSAAKLTGKESRSQISRLNDRIKAYVLEFTSMTVLPHFEQALDKQFGTGFGRVELLDEGEKVLLHYPSVVQNLGNYLSPSILLEFGGRNITEPNEKHLVNPLLVSVSSEVSYPEAEVTVLAWERTYWEKATLIHVECNRPKPRNNADRMSRHWYDLYRMSFDLDRIISEPCYKLLQDVVNHKSAFFHYSFARYHECLTGDLKLVPGNDLRQVLERDFDEMTEAAMFYTTPPPFTSILEHLQSVQEAINDNARG